MPLSLPYTLTNGTEADASQVMADLDAIVSYINALITIPSLPLSVPQGGTGATTVQGALTALGLGNKTIVNCNATATSGSAMQLVQAANTPTIASYQFGDTLVFIAPHDMSGPMTIQLGSLAPVLLYDTPGVSTTASLRQGQLCFVAYDSPLGAFVLVNTPPGSSSGFLVKANNLSDVASTSAALSNIGGAALVDFTFEQSLSGTDGFQPFPGLFKIKWGVAVLPASGGNTSSVNITYGVAFPTDTFVAFGSPRGKANSSTGGTPAMETTAVVATGFTLTGDTNGFATFNQTVNVFWMALGT